MTVDIHRKTIENYRTPFTPPAHGIAPVLQSWVDPSCNDCDMIWRYRKLLKRRYLGNDRISRKTEINKSLAPSSSFEGRLFVHFPSYWGYLQKRLKSVVYISHPPHTGLHLFCNRGWSPCDLIWLEKVFETPRTLDGVVGLGGFLENWLYKKFVCSPIAYYTPKGID